MTTATDSRPGTCTRRRCITSEVDRQRYAAISRALADPKRLCVLEVLATGNAP